MKEISFDGLDLIQPILNSLKDQGYTHPTPIQAQTIPMLLKGRDVLGCAQTGTGKTAAFAIPVLQNLNAKPIKQKGPKPTRALILTPTRELAIQIDESFKAYGSNLPLRRAVIFGGVGQNPQVTALRRGVEVVTATPGRLLDLMNQGHIKLDKLEMFVLDEADRMLDMGFINDVKRIVKKIPQKRQTLLFSATMPEQIAKLSQTLLHNPARVEVAPQSTAAETVEQVLHYVNKKDKPKLLIELLKDPNMFQVLVFTRTKRGANQLVKALAAADIDAAAIHGNKSQSARQKALQQFKDGGITVLAATDIAARGIDIDQLKFVVNHDLPNEPETYVHRIGRTGRAGASGKAISFCGVEEKKQLKDIQKLIGQKIKVITGHPYENALIPTMEAPPKKKAQRGGGGRRNSSGGRKQKENGDFRPAPFKKKSSKRRRPNKSGGSTLSNNNGNSSGNKQRTSRNASSGSGPGAQRTNKSGSRTSGEGQGPKKGNKRRKFSGGFKRNSSGSGSGKS